MGNEIFTINDMDLDKSKYNNKTIYAVNHNIISNGKDIKTIVISYIYHYKYLVQDRNCYHQLSL